MEYRLFQPDLFQKKEGNWVLVGCKCAKCGAISFPANELCTSCLSEDMETVEIAPKGRLYSYTITRRPVDRWPAPHAIGMISIPEQELRIMAPLIMENGDETFHVGEEMEMEIAKYWDEEDGEVFGYKYRPVRTLKEDEQ